MFDRNHKCPSECSYDLNWGHAGRGDGVSISFANWNQLPVLLLTVLKERGVTFSTKLFPSSKCLHEKPSFILSNKAQDEGWNPAPFLQIPNSNYAFVFTVINFTDGQRLKIFVMHVLVFRISSCMETAVIFYSCMENKMKTEMHSKWKYRSLNTYSLLWNKCPEMKQVCFNQL